MIEFVTTLLRYRALIGSLVSRELKARYRGNMLGFLWSFVNPLLLLLVYVLVFTIILPVKRSPAMEPYSLFFFCGILPWTWFSSSLLESAGVLIAGSNLIRKVLFPAEVLPTVTVTANLVHFLLGLPILLIFLVWYGRLTWTALLLPLPILVQYVFSLGLGLLLAALTVHFRDVQDILGHVLHLAFFASPILYLYGSTDSYLRRALRLNPMAHVLVSYQQILFDGAFDHWKGLAAAGVVALITFAVGAWFFDRLRDTFVEGV
jgi:lipopolysaccharide transport system permease protein